MPTELEYGMTSENDKGVVYEMHTPGYEGEKTIHARILADCRDFKKGQITPLKEHIFKELKEGKKHGKKNKDR